MPRDTGVAARDGAAVALNTDTAAPKHAKVLSKPAHLRELVTEVQKMLAA
jgi:two-component system cell cycle response regulator CpdR